MTTRRRAMIGNEKSETWDYSWEYSAGNPPPVTGSNVTDLGNAYSVRFPLWSIAHNTNMILEMTVKFINGNGSVPQMINMQLLGGEGYNEGYGVKVYRSNPNTLSYAASPTDAGVLKNYPVNLDTIFIKMKIVRKNLNYEIYLDDVLVKSGTVGKRGYMWLSGFTATNVDITNHFKSAKYKSWS